MLITCPKRFGPFRPMSESYRENGIWGALRFGYVLRGWPQAFFYVPNHTHSTDVNGVILNYGCKVTNNIWNNDKQMSTFFNFRNGKKVPCPICNDLIDREIRAESEIK